MEQLKDRPHTAGLRTTLRAVENGKAVKVFIAQDADVFVRRRAQEAAQAAGIGYEYVPSMKELGESCALAIKTACAALIRE
ncbi:MAG: ribosomal L7Ae/L30e/S12e/Gadd45 family protein [Clostridia bacterium]|nr:ribosomal L7Ae/L30e/S12e/Gadd45 family protein [Clostridia bacterium]